MNMKLNKESNICIDLNGRKIDFSEVKMDETTSNILDVLYSNIENIIKKRLLEDLGMEKNNIYITNFSITTNCDYYTIKANASLLFEDIETTLTVTEE